MITASKRKSIFIVLTVFGAASALTFLIVKEIFLFFIGVLFAITAAYNITCKDKK